MNEKKISSLELKSIIEEVFKDYEPFLVQVAPGTYRIGDEKSGYVYTGEGGKNEFIKALKEAAVNYKYEEESKSDCDPLLSKPRE